MKIPPLIKQYNFKITSNDYKDYQEFTTTNPYMAASYIKGAYLKFIDDGSIGKLELDVIEVLKDG